jgi:hypothetical protein
MAKWNRPKMTQKESALMREKKFFSLAALFSCAAIAVLMMGLAGCSVDKNSETSQNGISAPAPEPEGANYTITAGHNSIILGGISSSTLQPDPLCGIEITVRDSPYSVVVDATVELRWNDSDYPSRLYCVAGTGTTHTFGDGVHHLYATTNAYGVAKFLISGSYANTISCGGGQGDSGNPRKVSLYIEGNLESSTFCNVSTADLNGTGGVTSADRTKFNIDDACTNYYSRSDFDGNGVVNSADGDILDAIIAGGNSNSSDCE